MSSIHTDTPITAAMRRNRVGRSDVHLSAVGFGTFQLQLVPEAQAIDTLVRGFELGVNWVHTSHEYGGAEPLITRAISRYGGDVAVVNQASGEPADVESVIDKTCRLTGKQRLEMFGINCIDDAEFRQQNVWGAGGLVELLVREKREGRIRAIFCSTHGTPDYIAHLITCGVFDAVMLPYNPLGFHVLSYFEEGVGRVGEDLEQNQVRLFPLAEEHGVALLVMKPLAGGLLCRGQAFPPYKWLGGQRETPTARDVLQTILQHPAVCAVVPGTASITEAEENALAGHEPVVCGADRTAVVDAAIDEMKTTLCSRCGLCESSCSQKLRISFLFRDGYIWNYRSESPVAEDYLNYFTLHPSTELTCHTCLEQTCRCPSGIDIPRALHELHAVMLDLREDERLPPTPDEELGRWVQGRHWAQLVTKDLPRTLAPGAAHLCRLWLHNSGAETWSSPDPERNPPSGLGLGVVVDGTLVERVALRHDVASGERTHFAFVLRAPDRPGIYEWELFLMPLNTSRPSVESTRLLVASLRVEEEAPAAGAPARSPTAGDHDASQRAPQARQYGVEYAEHDIPDVEAEIAYAARVTVINRSNWSWRSAPPDGSVYLMVSCGGSLLAYRPLPRAEVAPGEAATFHFPLRLTGGLGRRTLELELVEHGGSQFREHGVRPLTCRVGVGPSPRTSTAEAYASAAHRNPWYYQPSEGIARSRDGQSFPLFVSRAKGYRLWDPEGHEYLDYVMGWGAALLGYADDRVQAAIGSVLGTAPLTPFPHPLEMDVTRTLCETFPGAEMVVFGKNGSDVCTVAARLARAFTGRTTILHCGYHGWQDFWAEQLGFGRSGVPDRPAPIIYRFRFNDPESFLELYRAHRHDLAAVMLEPSGLWGREEVGPEATIDPTFLEVVTCATRDAGALLVFDEIMTAFRYRNGSVQQARGIVPDLTCLGKALAAGMPLAALVGRADVFRRSLPQVFYSPTFKGEVYSFAAAKAALEIYRREPVVEHVWNYGGNLARQLNGLCRQLSLRASCKGPPFAPTVTFTDPNRDRQRAMRSLYLQEMLKQGVVTRDGLMLPSYAHDQTALQRTVAAAGWALQVVATAEREDAFDRYLELPLLP